MEPTRWPISGAAVEYFESPVRKDQRARAIAARHGITEGLVRVFATIEPCRSFRLASGPRAPDDPARRGGSVYSYTLLARYRRLDNAFLWLEDPGRVQRGGEGRCPGAAVMLPHGCRA
jgi:hypothetical protein